MFLNTTVGRSRQNLAHTLRHRFSQDNAIGGGVECKCLLYRAVLPPHRTQQSDAEHSSKYIYTYVCIQIIHIHI